MGANNSKNSEDTLNWADVKTNNFSPTIPNMNGISHEANELYNKLSIDIPGGADQDSSDFLNKSQLSESPYSSSSPFITSEMYKYVMNNYKGENNIQQQGGTIGDKEDEDEDDTSLTSSSSPIGESDDDELDVSEKKDTKKHKKNIPEKKEENIRKLNKHKKDGKKIKREEIKHENDSNQSTEENNESDNEEENDEMEGGSNTDYLSSSAHTQGNYEDTISNENISIKSSSINTSDVNMLS